MDYSDLMGKPPGLALVSATPTVETASCKSCGVAFKRKAGETWKRDCLQCWLHRANLKAIEKLKFHKKQSRLAGRLDSEHYDKGAGGSE